jgi:hypothetical protein
VANVSLRIAGQYVIEFLHDADLAFEVLTDTRPLETAE